MVYEGSTVANLRTLAACVKTLDAALRPYSKDDSDYEDKMGKVRPILKIDARQYPDSAFYYDVLLQAIEYGLLLIQRQRLLPMKAISIEM
jgi:hypothetical protein